MAKEQSSTHTKWQCLSFEVGRNVLYGDIVQKKGKEYGSVVMTKAWERLL